MGGCHRAREESYVLCVSCVRRVVVTFFTPDEFAPLFKEFATDDSSVSFELCRVVLVVCRTITNADMVMVTRKKNM